MLLNEFAWTTWVRFRDWESKKRLNLAARTTERTKISTTKLLSNSMVCKTCWDPLMEKLFLIQEERKILLCDSDITLRFICLMNGFKLNCSLDKVYTLQTYCRCVLAPVWSKLRSIFYIWGEIWCETLENDVQLVLSMRTIATPLTWTTVGSGTSRLVWPVSENIK